VGGEAKPPGVKTPKIFPQIATLAKESLHKLISSNKLWAVLANVLSTTLIQSMIYRWALNTILKHFRSITFSYSNIKQKLSNIPKNPGVDKKHFGKLWSAP